MQDAASSRQQMRHSVWARTQQGLIGAQGWGWAGRPVASSEHIFLKWPIFINFKVIYLHDDGKSYKKTNKSSSKEAGRPCTRAPMGAHVTGLLPSAHSLVDPIQGLIPKRLESSCQVLCQLWEHSNKHMGHGPCSFFFF